MPEWLNAQLQASLNMIPAYANGLSVLMDRFVTSSMSTCPRPAPRCSSDSLERG
jgi:hypothetical protein